MSGPTFAILHRNRAHAVDLREVKRCGQAEPLAGQCQASDRSWTFRVALGIFELIDLLAYAIGLIDLRCHRTGLVHTPMDPRALFRVCAGQKNSFDCHVVEQSGAIGVFGNTPAWPQSPVHNDHIGQ